MVNSKKKKVEKSSTIKMTTTFDFNGCYYYESKFNFCRWTLTMSISSRAPLPGEGDDEWNKKLSISYCKVTSWMQHFVSDIHIVGIKEKAIIEWLFMLDLGNPIMMTPGTPTDDLLVRLLHAKANSIFDGDFVVDEMVLSESSRNTKYMFDMGMAYGLPEQKDFVGKNPLHNVPWWERNDCDTCDLEVPKGEKRADMLKALDSSVFFRDIEATLNEDTDDEPKNKPKGRVPWKPEKA